MCGISGFLSTNNRFDITDLKSMTDALAHRGPNAVGYYTDDLIGLGHRRLSIIDLSTSANQPMVSGCGRYLIIYNGEVYNFQEIATELKQLKPQLNFKTTSDTEVIIEAFVFWGEQFVERLNGMFAIAIYDKQKQELYIYRDRMGIKPIYYFWDKSNFVFASELKSLKLLKNKIDLKINPIAINEFLHLGYIPEPHSIYENIKKLPAGTYVKVSDNELITNKYWNVENTLQEETEKDYLTSKQTLQNLIESSVKYRMISDVPFGTFLSGGIDSSLVTAVSQKFSNKAIDTFSIGFKETKNNEAVFAKTISDRLKTNHHEWIVTQKEARDLVIQLPDIYDEPYADSSAIPTLIVSTLASKHVKMILSGDGGDELFMGYGAYQWAKRLNNPLVNTFGTTLAMGLSMGSNKYKKAEELLKHKENKTQKSHIFSQEQSLFTRNEIKTLICPDFYVGFNLNENYENLIRILQPEEQQALFDINYYLKDDLLVKVDRATMYHSLETRVPLLDFRIVEFAVNLSPALKIKNGETKYLLKQVLYEYLPKELFNRPKQGFSIPLASWLKNELRFLIEDYLSEKVIKKHQIVNYNVVSELKEQFINKNNEGVYNKIWLLIILHQWLEKNIC